MIFNIELIIKIICISANCVDMLSNQPKIRHGGAISLFFFRTEKTEFSRKRNPVMGMVMDFRASRPSHVDPRSSLRSAYCQLTLLVLPGHHLTKNPTPASARMNGLSCCTLSYLRGLLLNFVIDRTYQFYSFKPFS